MFTFEEINLIEQFFSVKKLLTKLSYSLMWHNDGRFESQCLTIFEIKRNCTFMCLYFNRKKRKFYECSRFLYLNDISNKSWNMTTTRDVTCFDQMELNMIVLGHFKQNAT